MFAPELWILLIGLVVEGALALGLVRSYRRRVRQQNEKFVAEITDRREIERELAHMASFSEMAPTPIVETDVHQKIYYLNPAASAEFPDLEKQGWKHLAFERMEEVVQAMQKEGQKITSRPLKLGDKVYEQQIALLDNGPRVRVYFSDITELKRLDQLKTDFVNMVSHELRSPMTTINATIKMVSAELLGPLSADQKEALALTLKGIDRLSRLINELLDVSKIEAGKLVLCCESVELKTLIGEVVRNFEPLAKERGLALKTDGATEPLELFVDRDKMMQVFTNLIQNALKFTQQGGISVGFDAVAEGVLCWIADTGPGISAEQLPKLFGKFQQLGPAPKGREKGTGLGLSLCKGIVELHRGRIWAESKLGEGTRFLFVLPKGDAEGAFRDEAQHLLQTAIDNERPLTLMRLALIPAGGSPRSGSPELAGTSLQQLQTVVKSVLGTETMIVDRSRNTILLALVEIAKTAAQVFSEQIIHEFHPKSGAGSALPVLDIGLATFPDDGLSLEPLLQRLAAP